MKFKIVLVFLGIFCLQFFEIAHAGPCSEPIVVIMMDIGEDALFQLQADYAFQEDEIWKSELGQKVVDLLGTVSSGVEIHSIDEIYLGKKYDKHFLDEHPDKRAALKGEYLLRVAIYALGGRYQFYASLVSIDTTRIVKFESRYGDMVFEELSWLISSFGNLGALIRAWEMAHPAPVRDPIYEITVDPEKVKAQEGQEEAEIKVKVIHCNGLPSYDKVYQNRIFFKKETLRGHVKAELADSSSIVRSDGTASAKYKLDQTKGIGPGVDTIQFWTYGRGRKRFNASATIEIIGPLEWAWTGTLTLQQTRRFDCEDLVKEEKTTKELKQHDQTMCRSSINIRIDDIPLSDLPVVVISGSELRASGTCYWSVNNSYDFVAKSDASLIHTLDTLRGSRTCSITTGDLSLTFQKTQMASADEIRALMQEMRESMDDHNKIDELSARLDSLMNPEHDDVDIPLKVHVQLIVECPIQAMYKYLREVNGVPTVHFGEFLEVKGVVVSLKFDATYSRGKDGTERIMGTHYVTKLLEWSGHGHAIQWECPLAFVLEQVELNLTRKPVR